MYPRTSSFYANINVSWSRWKFKTTNLGVRPLKSVIIGLAIIQAASLFKLALSNTYLPCKISCRSSRVCFQPDTRPHSSELEKLELENTRIPLKTHSTNSDQQKRLADLPETPNTKHKELSLHLTAIARLLRPRGQGRPHQNRALFLSNTCDFLLPEPTPQFLGLAQRPALDASAEAAEEFVLLEVRHGPWSFVRASGGSWGRCLASRSLAPSIDWPTAACWLRGMQPAKQPSGSPGAACAPASRPVAPRAVRPLPTTPKPPSRLFRTAHYIVSLLIIILHLQRWERKWNLLVCVTSRLTSPPHPVESGEWRWFCLRKGVQCWFSERFSLC